MFGRGMCQIVHVVLVCFFPSQRFKHFAVITDNLLCKSLILFSSPCNNGVHFLLHDTFNVDNWIPLTDLCFKQGDDRTGE